MQSFIFFLTQEDKENKKGNGDKTLRARLSTFHAILHKLNSFF